MSTEKILGQVIPQYEGTLANRMIWRIDRLEAFRQKADLRSRILVQADDINPSSLNYSHLGEVLALKKVDFPQMYSSPTDEDPFFTISNLHRAQITVSIHHRRLLQQLQEQHPGRLNEELFVQRFNDSVVRGIIAALAREKLPMIGFSAEVGGATGGLLGASGFPAIWYLKNGLESFATHNINYVGALETILGINILLIFREFARSFINVGQQEVSKGNRYIKSLHDVFNPLKQIKDFSYAKLYLLTSGRHLAEYSS